MVTEPISRSHDTILLQYSAEISEEAILGDIRGMKLPGLVVEVDFAYVNYIYRNSVWRR